MDPGIDTGPILSQRATPIRPRDTSGTLFERLSTLGADLLLETLPQYLAGEIHPQPQPEEGATYASMLKKEDGRLDWIRPAQQLARRVRAFNPWPGAFFEWHEGALKVLGAHTAEAQADPGQHIVHEKLPAVGTSDGLLVLDEVQPPGKRPMPGRAFLAGARDW
jgi:methionyl-tRNA formyltransferase